jgi:uncharacterized protein YdeI (YjbR/CyaY-like superfamily)
LDTEPRIVDVPKDFQKLLSKNAVAKGFFDNLSYSNKKGIVTSIEDAKTEETRIRRMGKAIENLA